MRELDHVLWGAELRWVLCPVGSLCHHVRRLGICPLTLTSHWLRPAPRGVSSWLFQQKEGPGGCTCWPWETGVVRSEGPGAVPGPGDTQSLALFGQSFLVTGHSSLMKASCLRTSFSITQNTCASWTLENM